MLERIEAIQMTSAMAVVRQQLFDIGDIDDDKGHISCLSGFTRS